MDKRKQHRSKIIHEAAFCPVAKIELTEKWGEDYFFVEDRPDEDKRAKMIPNYYEELEEVFKASEELGLLKYHYLCESPRTDFKYEVCGKVSGHPIGFGNTPAEAVADGCYTYSMLKQIFDD